MKIFKFILLLFTIKINFILIMGKSCDINMAVDSPSHYSPLLLHDNLRDGFLYRNFEFGVYKFTSGEIFNVACSGKKVPENSILRIKCEDNEFLNTNTGKHIILNNIYCENPIKYVVEITKNPCKPPKKNEKPGKGVSGTIGFKIISNKKQYDYTIIDFCHDKTMGNTIYAHSIIQAQIKSYHPKIDGTFSKDNQLSDTPMDEIYTKKKQFETFTKIFNSEIFARQLIPETGPFFLAKGHLAAKTDFIYGAQQRATFSYVNAIPMWQIINRGNWLAIEDSVRDYAHGENCDLHVWTGGIGVLQISSEKGILKDIYLNPNNEGKQSIPVPKLLFKVVYDSIGKAGVAFITINNPHLKSHGANYVPCKNICHVLTWLTAAFKSDDYKKGYTHCCKVEDFRNLFSELPDFQTDDLLNTLAQKTKKPRLQ